MPAVKHEMSSENECPATPSLPKKPRSTSRSSEADVKPSTPRKNAKVKSERGAFTPTRKMGSWSREELKLLYTIMCPKLVSGLRYGWVRWEAGEWLTIDRGQMGRGRQADRRERCESLPEQGESADGFRIEMADDSGAECRGRSWRRSGV